MSDTIVGDLTSVKHFVPKTCPSCKHAVGAKVDVLISMGLGATIDSDTGEIMFLMVGDDDLEYSILQDISCAHCGSSLEITEEEE